MACRNCTSTNMEIIELKGKGNIQTFTTINVAPLGRENEVPYTIVLVELDEGPWIMGNLIEIDPSKATMELIGKSVKMGQSKVFPGDKYSAGDGARPLFSFEA
ncbi:MAG: OB-fold domain-containing protein, partial [Chloroflexi bacterium]|nr:OB-fold domain-containing protein [Chloroflexota bacterium]